MATAKTIKKDHTVSKRKVIDDESLERARIEVEVLGRRDYTPAEHKAINDKLLKEALWRAEIGKKMGINRGLYGSLAGKVRLKNGYKLY